MKNKTFKLIALTLCTFAALTACTKKAEPAAEASGLEPQAVSMERTNVETSASKETVTSEAAEVSAAGCVALSDLTGIDFDAMSEEESTFYNLLCKVACMAFDFAHSGCTEEEYFGSEGVTEQIIIDQCSSAFQNEERRQSAIKVLTGHYDELSKEYDANLGAYPEWEKLYDEFSGNSGEGFTSSVSNGASFAKAVSNLALTDSVIYGKDGVEFKVDGIDGGSENGNSGSMDLKVVNNNSNNKKVRFIVWNVCVNGIGLGEMWDSNEVLVGDEVSCPCSISYSELMKTWNAYGVSLNDAPIETVGIYYSVQIGSDSEFEYAYTELKTNNYSSGDTLFGTKIGSIDISVPNLDYTAEIPASLNVYKFDAVDGIVIGVTSNYPCFNNAPTLMINDKKINADSYVYGGSASAYWIKLSDEATLRREFELGPEEAMNLRYECQGGSVTIIE